MCLLYLCFICWYIVKAGISPLLRFRGKWLVEVVPEGTNTAMVSSRRDEPRCSGWTEVASGMDVSLRKMYPELRWDTGGWESCNRYSIPEGDPQRQRELTRTLPLPHQTTSSGVTEETWSKRGPGCEWQAICPSGTLDGPRKHERPPWVKSPETRIEPGTCSRCQRGQK